MIRKYLILTQLFFLTSIYAQRQPYYYNYSVNEGLPSSQAYSVKQDANGYIWVGTDRGLAKFDGYSFETFSRSEGASTAVFFQIDEGKEGEIWCVGDDNKIWILKNGKFIPYGKNDELSESVSSNLLVNYFDVLENEEVLIGFHSEKVFYIDSSGIQSLIDEDCTSQLRLFNFEDRSFAVSNMCGWSEIRATYPEGFSIEVVEGSPDNISGRDLIDLPPEVLPDRYRKSKHGKVVVFGADIYFIHNHLIYKLNETHEIEPFQEFNNDILCLKLFGDQMYVGVRSDGLFQTDLRTGEQQQILMDRNVTDVLIDKNNGIWATTLYNGLYYFPFQSLSYIPTEDDIVGLEFYQGNLVSGNVSGEVKFRNRSLEVESVVKVGLETSCIKFMEGMDFMVVGSYDRQLAIFGKNSGEVSFSELPLHLRDIEELGDDLYYISKSRFFRLRKTDMYSEDLLGMEKDVFSCLAPYEQGSFLIGGRSGLYHYSTKTGQFSEFLPKYTKGVRFTDALRMDPWTTVLSTRGFGLMIIQDSVVMMIGEESGLISSELDALSLSNGKLAVSSKKGVSVISPGEKENTFMVTNYSNKNGLLSNEISDIIFSHDTLWVATDKGISVLNLDQLDNQDYQSILELRSVLISEAHKPPADSYQLKHSEDRIEVSYNCISFPQNGSIRYRFKMDGLDESWNYTSERSFSYKSIPYGDYVLRIGFQEVDGRWSESEIKIQIFRERPFWLTAWFFGVMILVFALVGYLISRYRSNIKMKAQAQEIEMHELERMAYQAQMNPHFIFNALNTIQSFISHEENENAQDYLSTFSRLVRTSLNHSDQKFVTVSDEIRLIKDYVEIEMIRFPDHFDFTVDFDPDLLSKWVPPMIIQPFIENAIDHGLVPKKMKGTLSLRIEVLNKELLRVEIIDDGIGVEAASLLDRRTHDSKGIRITRDRLKLYHSKATIEIGNAFSRGEYPGTKVVLTIPFQNESTAS